MITHLLECRSDRDPVLQVVPVRGPAEVVAASLQPGADQVDCETAEQGDEQEGTDLLVAFALVPGGAQTARIPERPEFRLGHSAYQQVHSGLCQVLRISSIAWWTRLSTQGRKIMAVGWVDPTGAVYCSTDDMAVRIAWHFCGIANCVHANSLRSFNS